MTVFFLTSWTYGLLYGLTPNAYIYEYIIIGHYVKVMHPIKYWKGLCMVSLAYLSGGFFKSFSCSSFILENARFIIVFIFILLN